MNAPTTKTQQQLAVVNIGHTHVLLPMTKAIKIIEALQGAVRVDHEYDRDKGEFFFTLREGLEVELKMVKPSQIRGGTITPPKRSRGTPQLQLGHTTPEVR